MIARIIIQTSKNGEKHVTVTQEFHAPLEDFKVLAPGWEDSTIKEGRVLILDMDEPGVMVDELADNELHSAWTQHSTARVAGRVV
jgi:hypothetical protein